MPANSYMPNARLAGVLFIAATTATVISQVIAEPILEAPDIGLAVQAQPGVFAMAAMFEVVNALASAGIAIALYPILKRVGETAAAGYLSIRAIEGATGVVAAVAFLWLLAGVESAEAALRFHEAAFLMVLIVFSVSTLILYPTLFRFRMVPVWISLWGLAGGTLLLVSCLMIAFGVHTMGSTSDGLLSLPIAVNEMVLAVWLIVRGVSVEERA